MNTHKKAGLKKPLRLLVFIPHRDTCLLIDKYRQKLFSLGFPGAYSFPVAAPLAMVSQAYNPSELKTLAHELRRFSYSKDGKITIGEAAQVSCSHAGLAGSPAFFGPMLDLPPLETLMGLNNEKLTFIFPKVVLCAAILSTEKEDPKEETLKVPDFLPFSFRAARVSNLAIRPIKGAAAPYSNEWRLGPDCWLPAYKRRLK